MDHRLGSISTGMGEGAAKQEVMMPEMVWGMILVFLPGYMYSELPFAMIGENCLIFQIEQKLVIAQCIARSLSKSKFSGLRG